jgi:hypothetical protein
MAKTKAKGKAKDHPQDFDTRVAHQVLLDGLENLCVAMNGAPLDRKVEVGSILWELGDHINEILNDVKKAIRIEAVARLGGKVGTCVVEGDDRGEASVKVPKATLYVPKGKNVDDLKQALGNDFPFFFEEVVTYKPRKEYEERVGSVGDALRKKILLEAVQRDEPTPRVSFKRHKPSKQEE